MNFGIVIACETLFSIADEMNRRLPDLINVFQQRAGLQPHEVLSKLLSRPQTDEHKAEAETQESPSRWLGDDGEVA